MVTGSDAEPLSLGLNVKTVSGVSFARSVKFQFTSGDVEFTELDLNGEDILVLTQRDHAYVDGD